MWFHQSTELIQRDERADVDYEQLIGSGWCALQGMIFGIRLAPTHCAGRCTCSWSGSLILILSDVQHAWSDTSGHKTLCPVQEWPGINGSNCELAWHSLKVSSDNWSHIFISFENIKQIFYFSLYFGRSQNKLSVKVSESKICFISACCRS